MKPRQPIALRISSAAEAQSAGETARIFAGDTGFEGPQRDEVALAVLELATNLVKHAGGGELKLRALEWEGRHGLEVVSEDHGPGITDVERAIGDGFTTAGTRGAGLGAVNRLMDEVEFSPRQDGGLRIVCQRWARPAASGPAETRLEFGAATRGYRSQNINGDAIVVRQWDNHALAGVVDGLGHGEFAQRAAHAARHYLEQHFDQPLSKLFRGAGRACRATRGVVMALAHFRLARQTVDLASVGNVDVWLLGSERPFQPVVRRGVIGQPDAPEPVVTAHPWTAASVLILHSDGVQGGWKAAELSRLALQSPVMAARELLELYGRVDDDATVLVARNAKPTGPLQERSGAAG